MYVGGHGPAAGGGTSLVGDAPTLADVPSRRSAVEDQLQSRAASGAARDARTGPLGAGVARAERSGVATLVLADVVAVVAAAFVAVVVTGLVAGANALSRADWALACALPPGWVALAGLNRGYDRRSVGFGASEIQRFGRTVTHLALATLLVDFVGGVALNRPFVLAALVCTAVAAAVVRGVFRRRLHRRRRAGQAMERVLVVGRSGSIQRIVAALRREPAAGLLPVGVCIPGEEADDPSLRRTFAELGVPLLGDLAEVRTAVRTAAAARVVVAGGDVAPRALQAIAWDLEETGAELIVSAGVTEIAHQRVKVQTVSGTPLLRIATPCYRGARRLAKGMVDRTAAACALVILAPVLLVLAALVRGTSSGPAFYLQERIGRDGRPFRMVKFRSMQVGADARRHELLERNEKGDGLLFKIREDPRVTPVGRWLRRFSLDELPQLFNVLAGSMSLVGPRPPLPSEVAMYEGPVQRRLLVKPGLTGLWQVSGRSDLSWEESVRLDLHYVENWSLGLDMRLLLKTAGVVVKGTGAY
jgi:exopolysaccharide biosynthesis polyprenyl glycosylphosphotransferase